MHQEFRTSSGGFIDRSKEISFIFNGKKYYGYRGDTLASALLANGVHLIGEALNIIDQEVFLLQALKMPMERFNYIKTTLQSLMSMLLRLN